MDYLKLKENACLICLEKSANFDWNYDIIESGGFSYKDCYYKHTQLEETDIEFCPPHLCDQCAHEVKNAHLLFERAVKSYTFLQNTTRLEQFEAEEYKVNAQNVHPNFACNENIFIERLEDEVSAFPVALDDTIEDTKIPIEEISIQEDVIIKDTKSFDNPLHEEPVSICDINKHVQLSLEIHNEEKRKEMRISNTVLKNTHRPLNNIASKVQLNNSLNNKSDTKELVKQTPHCPGKLVGNAIDDSGSQKLSSRKSFNKVLTHRPLAERKRIYPLASTSKSCISKKSQKSSTTKTDKTNAWSESSITEVIIERGNSIEMEDNSFLVSTIKSSEVTDVQKMSETTQSLEDELMEVINGKCEEENSLNARRHKHRYLCQYCPYKTNYLHNLSEHEETHLDNRERSVVCSQCGIKFLSKSSLRGHMDTHNENRTKKHKCEFCEKAFFNKGALNVHRRVHLGLMYKCQICQNEFYRQIDLDRHLVKHSILPGRNNIEKKKYVAECPQCKKSIFTHKLKEHMAIHSQQPQMKCKICDKEFLTRKRCTSHLRRFHKIDGDYANFIHSYVKSETRVSFLKTRQQMSVRLFTK